MQPSDLVDDRLKLLFARAENLIFSVYAAHGAVGRNDRHVELVDFPQLARLGFGRARHARQLVVHAEEVLQSDGSDRLSLVL